VRAFIRSCVGEPLKRNVRQLSILMEVSEPNTQRFVVALELLREGKAFTFDGVSLRIATDGSLQVSVDTSWCIENTTEQTALSDLGRAKNVLAHLAHESAAFKSIIEGRPQCFRLGYDCGKSGVELARLVDGKLVWARGAPLS
jgi:hypothetical protein